MSALSTTEARRQIMAEIKSRKAKPVPDHIISSLDDGSQPTMILSSKPRSRARRPRPQGDALKLQSSSSIKSSQKHSHSPPSSPSSTSTTSRPNSASKNVKATSSFSSEKSDRKSAVSRRSSSSASNASLPLIPAPKVYAERKTSTSSSKSSSPRRGSGSSSSTITPPPPISLSLTDTNVDLDLHSPSSPPPPPPPPPPLPPTHIIENSIKPEQNEEDDTHSLSYKGQEDGKIDATMESESVAQVIMSLPSSSSTSRSQSIKSERAQVASPDSLLSPTSLGFRSRQLSSSTNEVLRFFDNTIRDQSLSMTSLNEPQDDPLTDSTKELLTVDHTENKEIVVSTNTSNVEVEVPPLNLSDLGSHKSFERSGSGEKETVLTRQVKSDSEEYDDTSPRIEIMEFSKNKSKGQRRKSGALNVTKFRPDVKTVRQQIRPGTVDELATLFKTLNESEVATSPTGVGSPEMSPRSPLSPSSPRSDSSDDVNDIRIDVPTLEGKTSPRSYKSSSSRSSYSFSERKGSDSSKKSSSFNYQSSTTPRSVSKANKESKQLLQASQSESNLYDKQDQDKPPTFDFLVASKEIFMKVLGSKNSSRSNSFRNEKNDSAVQKSQSSVDLPVANYKTEVLETRVNNVVTSEDTGDTDISGVHDSYNVNIVTTQDNTIVESNAQANNSNNKRTTEGDQFSPFTYDTEAPSLITQPDTESTKYGDSLRTSEVETQESVENVRNSEAIDVHSGTAESMYTSDGERMNGKLSDTVHGPEILTTQTNRIELSHSTSNEAEQGSDLSAFGEIVKTVGKNGNRDHDFIYDDSSPESPGREAKQTAPTGFEGEGRTERGEQDIVRRSSSRGEEESLVWGEKGFRASSKLRRDRHLWDSGSERSTSSAGVELNLTSWTTVDDVSGSRIDTPRDVTVRDGGDSDSVFSGVKRSTTEVNKREETKFSTVATSEIDENQINANLFSKLMEELEEKNKNKVIDSESNSGSSSDEEKDATLALVQTREERNVKITQTVAQKDEKHDGNVDVGLPEPLVIKGSLTDDVNVTSNLPSSQAVQSGTTGLFAHPSWAADRTGERMAEIGTERGAVALTHSETSQRETATVTAYGLDQQAATNAGLDNLNKVEDNSNTGARGGDDFMSILDDIALESDITTNFTGKSNRLSSAFSPEEDDKTVNVDNVRDSKEYLSEEAVYVNPQHNVSDVSAGESDREHFHLGLDVKQTPVSVTTTESEQTNAYPHPPLLPSENHVSSNVSLDEEIKHLHRALSPKVSEANVFARQLSSESKKSVRSTASSTKSSIKGRSSHNGETKETSFNKEFFGAVESVRHNGSRTSSKSNISLENTSVNNVTLTNGISREAEIPAVNGLESKPPLARSGSGVGVRRSLSSASSHSTSRRSSLKSNNEIDPDEIKWSKDKFKALRESFVRRESQTDSLNRSFSSDRKRLSGQFGSGRLSAASSLTNIHLESKENRPPVVVRQISIESVKDRDKSSEIQPVITQTNTNVIVQNGTTSAPGPSRDDTYDEHVGDTSYSDSGSESEGGRTNKDGKKLKKRTKKYTYDVLSGEGKRDADSRKASVKSASSKGSKRQQSYDLTKSQHHSASSSSDSDDSVTRVNRRISKKSNKSDSSDKDKKEDKMTAVVGEVSTFSIHRKVTSVEESSQGPSFSTVNNTNNNNSIITTTATTTNSNTGSDSDVYLIQDSKGDYYALQEVDSEPGQQSISGNSVIQTISANGQIENNGVRTVQGSTDLYVDSSAVGEDKAREVITSFFDSQQQQQQQQYVSNGVYRTNSLTRDTGFVGDARPNTATSPEQSGSYHLLSTGVNNYSTPDGYNTLLSNSSFSSSSQQPVVVQQFPVETIGANNGAYPDTYAISGNSYNNSNNYLRNSTLSVHSQVDTKTDNAQTWETPGFEPFTTGHGSEDTYRKSMLVTNVNTPQQQVYIQESRTMPGLENGLNDPQLQHYVVRTPCSVLQPLSVNVNQDQYGQDSTVGPFQSRPITVTTTTNAVVGEKVDMNIEFPRTQIPTVSATAELVHSSSDEENKQRYRVRTVPTKSSLKKTSKYEDTSFDSGSDLVYTKKETVTADVTLGGKRREIKLYPDDRGSKRTSQSVSSPDSLSPTLPDGPMWKVHRAGGRDFHSRSLSPDISVTSPRSQDYYEHNSSNNFWKVKSYSNSEPDGLDVLDNESRGRPRSHSPTYRVVSSGSKHHSPERFFKNAKLSLRKDEYETKGYSSEEETSPKKYKTVSRVYLNGDSSKPRSRSPSPTTRYKISSVQHQESFERKRDDSAREDGRVYEVINVKSTNKGQLDDEDYSRERKRYRVFGSTDGSLDQYQVRAQSSPKERQKTFKDATITRTETVIPSRVNSVPPKTKSHRTVVQLEVGNDSKIKQKSEPKPEYVDSQYKVTKVTTANDSKQNRSFESPPSQKGKLWKTGRSHSSERTMRRNSSSSDSNSDLERTGVYDLSPKVVKTTKQKAGDKVFVVNSTVTDPHDEGAAVLYPPGWFQTTIDINQNKKDERNKNYVVYDRNEDNYKPSQTFTTDTSNAQSYRTEKTVYFVRDAPPPSNINKLAYRTQSSEFVSPDSGQGTEIASSDGEGEAIRQKYERVERIYEIRSEPELPEQYRDAEFDVSKDLRVLRGKILIKNRLDDDHDEDDFDENVNVFDNSFHLGKDNPLYSSDPDIMASLQREEEEMARQVNQDITFETVDRIAHKYSGNRGTVDLSPKPARKQNLSALLLSKLASVDSKDIRQSIDVEHHNEEIFGDIDFIHADGERTGSKNTSNFDSVNEKVELTLQQGKAYVIIKVIAERIVPTDYEFNVWRKSQAIVTRQIEIDLLANEQRRRLYNHVMDTVGPAGALEDGRSRGHSDIDRLPPHEKQLSGMETLKLFSQILDVADGTGDRDHTDMRTKQEMGRLPPSAGMDLLY